MWCFKRMIFIINNFSEAITNPSTFCDVLNRVTCHGIKIIFFQGWSWLWPWPGYLLPKLQVHRHPSQQPHRGRSGRTRPLVQISREIFWSGRCSIISSFNELILTMCSMLGEISSWDNYLRYQISWDNFFLDLRSAEWSENDWSYF